MRVLVAVAASVVAIAACSGAPDGAFESIRPGLPSDFVVPGLTTTYENVGLSQDAAIVERATVRGGLQAIEPTEAGATTELWTETREVPQRQALHAHRLVNAVYVDRDRASYAS